MDLKLGNNNIAPNQGKITQNPAPEIVTEYHSSEIEQNGRILNHLIRMLWAGLGVIIVGALLAAFGATTGGVVTAISGAFVDWVSSTVLKTLSKSNESKQKYFEDLAIERERDILLAKISKEKNDSFRESMLTRLVESHCERQSKAASK